MPKVVVRSCNGVELRNSGDGTGEHAGGQGGTTRGGTSQNRGGRETEGNARGQGEGNGERRSASSREQVGSESGYRESYCRDTCIDETVMEERGQMGGTREPLGRSGGTWERRSDLGGRNTTSFVDSYTPTPNFTTAGRSRSTGGGGVFEELSDRDFLHMPSHSFSPEVAKAIEGVKFIAQHLQKEDDARYVSL